MDIATMPFAPGGEGLMGHNGSFRADRLGMLNLLADTTEPIQRLRLPWRGVVAAVVNDPDLVQEAMVEKARHFDKSDMLRFSLFPLAGEGLFSSNGELWRRQRKLMAPMFHASALDRYASDMLACTRRVVDGWRDGRELSLLHETTQLTMSIAGKALFDADTFSEADALGQALTVALAWSGWSAGQPFAIAHILARRTLEDLAEQAPSWAKEPLTKGALRLRGPIAAFGARGRELAKAIAVLDERVQRMIDDRRAAVGANRTDDLLTRLLDARDEDDGQRMSDRQVRDEVLTLFVAGHETTATGLAWSIYLACKNPAVYAALEREVDALGRDPGVADLAALPLCLRVFREALRLYPPVYMWGRDTRGEVTLGGYRLPPRTNILISPWSLQRNKRFWPDPLRFDPDRFLPEVEVKRHRYAYIPFGAGPRICIGNHFAYMEAQIALGAILRRYRFELLADDVPDPGATLRPKNGVRVRVRARAAARETMGDAATAIA